MLVRQRRVRIGISLSGLWLFYLVPIDAPNLTPTSVLGFRLVEFSEPPSVDGFIGANFFVKHLVCPFPWQAPPDTAVTAFWQAHEFAECLVLARLLTVGRDQRCPDAAAVPERIALVCGKMPVMFTGSNSPSEAQVLARIRQLVANPQTDGAWVCSECGYKIATQSGFVIPERFANTCKVGSCEVCGRANASINPSYDWMGLMVARGGIEPPTRGFSGQIREAGKLLIELKVLRSHWLPF